MNFKGLLPRMGANAETVLLGSALHFIMGGKIDVKSMDADAVAIAVFSLADQLESAHPGIAEKYKWANIQDLARFSQALERAQQATKPDGLL